MGASLCSPAPFPRDERQGRSGIMERAFLGKVRQVGQSAELVSLPHRPGERPVPGTVASS